MKLPTKPANRERPRSDSAGEAWLKFSRRYPAGGRRSAKKCSPGMKVTPFSSANGNNRRVSNRFFSRNQKNKPPSGTDQSAIPLKCLSRESANASLLPR